MLWILLSINAAMFVAEITAGVIAESTGLIADSLDMLADDPQTRQVVLISTCWPMRLYTP